MIQKGTIVYHHSKGKGYIFDIKERRGIGMDLIICEFPLKGLEFITRQALLSGEAEITLKPQTRRMKNEGQEIDSLLEGLFRGL